MVRVSCWSQGTRNVSQVQFSGFWSQDSGSQSPKSRGASSRVPGVRVTCPRVACLRSQGPGCLGPMSQGPRAQGPRVPGLKVPGLGSLVLILDYARCESLKEFLVFTGLGVFRTLSNIYDGVSL